MKLLCLGLLKAGEFFCFAFLQGLLGVMFTCWRLLEGKYPGKALGVQHGGGGANPQWDAACQGGKWCHDWSLGWHVVGEVKRCFCQNQLALLIYKFDEL